MNAYDTLAVRETAEKLGLNEIIVDFLFKRGYSDYDAIHDFLSPKKEFTSVYTLKDAEAILARVKKAIEGKEKILVFGDYDCDGICATSILRLYFNKVGAYSCHFIPRRQDGYGLSIPSLSRVIDAESPSLIITVDCGISSVQEVEYCLSRGVDIIVTDHHEPQATLPDCLILNPKLTEGSPLRDICGAAVAMKLVEGLGGVEEANSYLDIVSLATVADVVPLVGENRKMVYYGLKDINLFRREGLKKLAMSAECTRVTSGDIGFRLAPRINALGRLNDETDVVGLFLEKDPFFISTLVEKIEKANKERQNVTKSLTEQCLEKITPEMLATRRILVLSDESWETGVLGLVASRITAMFYRPCILLGNGGNVLKGSARSIPDVNIFKCIEKVSELTSSFGGHQGAAGMSLDRSRLEEFTERVDKVVAEEYPVSVFVPDRKYDIKLSRSKIDLNFCRQLELLEPFGEGNPAPSFALSSDECKFARVGNTPHVKGRLNSETDVMAFSKEYLLDVKAYALDYEMTVDAAIKEFNNRKYVQLAVDKFKVDISNVKDNANAFSLYLKTLVYRETDTRITLSKDIPLFDNSLYGTLYLAFSADTARVFLSNAASHDFQPRIAGVTVEENPLSTLFLYPVDLGNIGYYKRIVFLDKPLSSGYVRYILSKAPNADVYIVDNLPYRDRIKALSTDRESVLYTAKKISDHLRTGRRVDSVNSLFFDLMSFGYNLSNETFAAHFYALYEVGWLRVGVGFSLACYGDTPDVSSSRVLKTIEKLKQ